MKSAQGCSARAAEEPQALGLWHSSTRVFCHGSKATPGVVLSINVIISPKDGASQIYEHPLCLQKRFTVGVPQIRRESWFPEASNTHLLNTICCFFKREALKGSRKRGRVVRHTELHTKTDTKKKKSSVSSLLCQRLGFKPSVPPLSIKGWEGTEFRIWQVAFGVHLWNPHSSHQDTTRRHDRRFLFSFKTQTDRSYILLKA